METVDGGDDGFIAKGGKEAIVDHGFGSGVYAAGGFVEQNEAAVAGGEDAAGGGEPLFLTAGKVNPFFTDIGFEAKGQVADDLGKVGAFADPEDLGCGEWETEVDIVGEGVLEDLGFLGEEGDGFVDAVEPGFGVGGGMGGG